MSVNWILLVVHLAGLRGGVDECIGPDTTKLHTHCLRRMVGNI
jgi:hypothetical protein